MMRRKYFSFLAHVYFTYRIRLYFGRSARHDATVKCSYQAAYQIEDVCWEMLSGASRWQKARVMALAVKYKHVHSTSPLG
jgi:thymidylate synthase ThyX